MEEQSNVKHRMVHIRLPSELHQRLKKRAEADGVTMQELAVTAIGRKLESTVESSSGLISLHRNQYSTILHTDFARLLSKAQNVDLLGTHLLDFLSDDGWGNGALTTFLEEERGQVRIVIEDKDSYFARWRVGHRMGVSPDDTVGISQTATYLRGSQAELHLQELLKSFPRNVMGRKNNGYPACRWLSLVDGLLLIQHHCPRSRPKGGANGSSMPVFGFTAQSAAATRFREYFENVWETGGAK